MPLLQNLDPGSLLLISIVLVFLCVIILLLFFGLQFIGSTVFGAIELVMTIIGGGPGMWCGCVVLLLACGLCVGVVLMISGCASNPSSMNFCLLFTGGA